MWHAGDTEVCCDPLEEETGPASGESLRLVTAAGIHAHRLLKLKAEEERLCL